MKILPNHLLQFEVGETIECNGKKYMLIIYNGINCDGCPLGNMKSCHSLACTSDSRDDGKEVIFREVVEEKMIEPQLNEIFELEGKRYKCVKDDGEGCFHCSFQGKDCSLIECRYYNRKDEEEVIFKEVKK